MLHVPLHRGFRYIHEPLPVGDTSIPVLGHEELVGPLRERLVYSHGGTFLITGFRGVGKTTLVLRALTQALSPPTEGGPDERHPLPATAPDAAGPPGAPLQEARSAGRLHPETDRHFSLAACALMTGAETE